ncbi:MAG TPA: FAD-binding protein [Spirochaetes bacterium]|nr:FAD-binding protein [Spirochaetota bacterium]
MTDTELSNLKKDLVAALGDSKIITDPSILETYARDETGDIFHAPDIAVRAGSTGDVSAVLRICSAHGVPVIPRGAGTGLTGGAVPTVGGVVLSLEKMNRIIEIDTRNMAAVVEPGVITGDLQRAVLEHGLMYPPDPASLDSCSIGGNVAEAAGGPRAVKYGTTRDYLLGLEFVLMDGSVISTGGKYVKNATGFNLCGLLTGSEGTLAVITKITLRLIPAAPHTLDILVPFGSMEEAVEAVYRIIADKILPAGLEFMEENAIRIVGKYLHDEMLFPDARAHLLIELDGSTMEEIERDLEKIGACLGDAYGRALAAESRAQSERLWKARRSIREAINAVSPSSLAEDSVVPRSEIPGFLKEVKSYFDGLGLSTLMFGHAGDGNVHIHVLQGTISDEQWYRQQPIYKKELYRIALSRGGTISGEHGIGCTRRDYLPMALSHDEIELLRRIKKAFDPRGLLNPGKIF